MVDDIMPLLTDDDPLASTPSPHTLPLIKHRTATHFQKKRMRRQDHSKP
jgi:hypothetical protein